MSHLTGALIERHADADTAKEDGWTPLMLAATNGHMEIVRMLLAAGANPAARHDDKRTALEEAEAAKHDDIARLLRDTFARGEAFLKVVREGKKAAIERELADRSLANVVDADGVTPLMLAAGMGRADLCRLLLDRGASPVAADQNGFTALCCACNAEAESLETVVLLSDAGSDMNARTRGGGDALILAALKGHAALVELLLARGARVDARDNRQQTALAKASFIGREDIVRRLLAKEAPVNAADENGITPLMLAAQEGELAVVKLLVAAADIQVNLRDEDRNTALSYAARDGHTAVVDCLLGNRADVNNRSKIGWTPLMFAAIQGHQETVERLLAAGADCDLAEDHGWTAADMAGDAGHAAVADLLQKRTGLKKAWFEAVHAGDLARAKELRAQGTNLDLRNSDGATALIVAAALGKTALCLWLLESGADPQAHDERGFTALMTACEAPVEQLALARLLLDKGGAVNGQSSGGASALMNAVKMGHCALAEYLIEKGADINARNQHLVTPLIWAADAGHVEMTRMLIEKGADTHALTDNGYTAATIAAENGHEAVVALLRPRKE